MRRWEELIGGWFWSPRIVRHPRTGMTVGEESIVVLDVARQPHLATHYGELRICQATMQF